ncbi:MAG TPA: citramalate synthase [Dehalococcoidia bacterium]|nr:citramalate synthase [Dehalococcoidia bacterium]
MTVQLYDTTLRDGAQMEGISLSVEDKVRIARRLDELGVHFIEGGWPGANRKDVEFFQRMQDVKLNAKLVAFGSTRRAGADAARDPTLRHLVTAGTDYVTIVGKAHELHVREVLGTSLEENLAMLADSVRFLKSRGKAVFYDAEHFFDGFRADADYAIACLRATVNNGVDGLVLCDTNGGTLTADLLRIIEQVQAAFPNVPLGIHCHNDADVAVANSLAAVQAGVQQVQACINGYGERCGNANMASIIAALKLKLGQDVVTDEQLSRLTEICHFVSEVANMTPWPQQPYVGASAFAHKAGLHTDAVLKIESAYQHIDPAKVGNQRRLLVSELGGSRGLLDKLADLGIDYPLTREQARELSERIKDMEAQGYQYEGADASLELLVRRSLPGYSRPFNLDDFWVVERRSERAGDRPRRNKEMQAEAMVKVRVYGRGEGEDQVRQTAADGNGPVNALDNAVRKALSEFYPDIENVRLVDYKVRVVDSTAGTGASVRVLIECSDETYEWECVGASTDIIEASWLALADAYEWWLLRHPG